MTNERLMELRRLIDTSQLPKETGNCCKCVCLAQVRFDGLPWCTECCAHAIIALRAEAFEELWNAASVAMKR